MNYIERYIRAVISALAFDMSGYQKQLVSVVIVVIGVIAYFFMFSPPSDFPSGSIVNIEKGSPAPLVAQQLSDARIIAHPEVLRLILRISGASNRVQAGIYRFGAPENLFTVAHRIIIGDYGLPFVNITFIEGTTVSEMAEKISNAFPLVSADDILSQGKPYEGYLFPDTYSFPPSSDAVSIIETMRKNFDTKILKLSDDIQKSGLPLSDIVIIASLIEKEARTSENKRIIAGIILNRLELDMLLQIDAVFGYIFNRDTYPPSFADLTVDSPYNTYTHKGLPPGPINNPGLDSIEAVLHPTKTDYLYYLTGKDGLMHYATTYTGHKANIQKYLGN